MPYVDLSRPTDPINRTFLDPKGKALLGMFLFVPGVHIAELGDLRLKSPGAFHVVQNSGAATQGNASQRQHDIIAQ